MLSGKAHYEDTKNSDTLSLQGRYFEAAVTHIDPVKQSLTANFPKHAGLEQYDFEVPYDILVYSVGSVVNTFGIQVGEPLIALLWLLQARSSQCSTRSCRPQLLARLAIMHMAIRLPASFCCSSATCI